MSGFTACWAGSWATAGPSPSHAALGNGAYRLLELEPDGLAPFLHRKDIGGLNVTIPYKRDVMPLCDEIDPAAEAIGSVNTIVRCADGKLVGYNTDIDGFLYMACRAGISLSGKKVVILGSGRGVSDGPDRRPGRGARRRLWWYPVSVRTTMTTSLATLTRRSW